jgi:hypothetical protein
MSVEDDVERIQEMMPYLAPRLAKYHERFLGGKAVALLDALEVCATFRIPPPQWAADEFVKRFLSWAGFDVLTLDEAFGVTRKGVQRKARQQREQLGYAVWSAAKRLHQQENVPIGDQLWDRIAEVVVGCSPALAKKIYYEQKEFWEK